jgi:RecB family exonuclease
VPCHFETAFGNAPREGQDRLSQREPFILTIDGCEYRFSGKIDRIDLNGSEARLIDYKTSSVPTPKSIKLGLSLQLTLYSWAVEDFLLPEYAVKEAYYIPLVKGKPRESLFEQKGADSAARQEVARARLAEAVAGIRSGYFPPQPDENYSDAQGSFHTAARYEEWRIALKCPDRNAPEDTDDTDD